MAAKQYKRNIRATLHRASGNSTEVIWVKYYSNISNAIRRAVELSIFTGQPGDVLEFTSSNFDYLIATIKLKVGVSVFANMDIEFHIGKKSKKSNFAN